MLLSAQARPIRVVYDIGANDGEWSLEVRSKLPKAAFYLFEANPVHAPALDNTGLPYFIKVLSSERRNVEFYSTGSRGDSYFRENSRHYDHVTPQSVEADTLDQIASGGRLPPPDFIKLDTQGSELDILRGAPRALSAAHLVLIECPITAYNLGAPKIGEYLAFMESSGFIPVELTDTHHANGALIQIDLLFSRRQEAPLREMT